MTDAPATPPTAAGLVSDAEAALVKADMKLNSAQGLLLIQNASAADKAAAGQAMVDTGLAIQALRQAQIDAIADQLEADADALRKATNDLNKALQQFQAVKPIIDGISALVGVLGRIIAIV